MKIKNTIDVGEYKIVVTYDNSGSGHIVVELLDELDGPIDSIEVINSTDDE